MGRLLWPVNILSFALLILLCAMMVYRAKTSVASAMRSKAEGFVNFLQSAGQTYVANQDLSALEKFTTTISADPDFAYVVYLNGAGQPMTESSRIIESDKIARFEKDIVDAKNTVIGKIAIGIKYDRIDEAFWGTLRLGIACLILTQLFLSGAIFFVSRGIVQPLMASLGRLSRTTHVLANTSNNVSKFSDALSSGVNQQAEVVQETTASMSEMSSMLTQTSNYAKQSDAVMTAVTQKANEGMAVMNQMVDAMSSVQQANEHLQQMVEIIQEIGNKTKVINDIVFKTQLLSFNASIEAARAGTHGRGFAVVAEEVGNLAKMSGNAAQEITSLLHDSEKQVNEIVRNNSERVSIGKNVTEQALKGFKDIANDINLISNQIDNISAAAREQELGVAQTNLAMTELNKTTDLNSHIAQSANAASRILASEVQSLTEIAQSIEKSLHGSGRPQLADAPASLNGDGDWGPATGEGAQSASVTALPTLSSPATMTEIDTVTDKIVEMAKKQRAEKKAKQSG